MTLRQRIRLFQQLATLTKAGVPLVTGLERLSAKFNLPQVSTLATEIRDGALADQAFRHAKFSPFECHLIQVGVQSARLETIFEHLAQYWIFEYDLRAALTTQLAYPIFVLHLSLIVSAIPGAIHGGFNGYVLALVANLFWLYLGIIPVLVILFLTWRTEAGQRFWLAWPIVGTLLSATYSYRWITALRLEYSAGLPLPDAVGDAWRASSFPGYALLAVQAEKKMREGVELSALMHRWPWLPRDWIDFIETAEISGALETTFNTLAEEAQKAALLAQKSMSSVLPKVFYFIIIVITALQIFHTIWDLVISPIQSIDHALGQ